MHMENNDQIVYIMVNEAMPDYIKIGRTNDLERRLVDLDWTNLPLPFRVYYAARVKDASLTESKLHDAFADNRIRSNREFFKVNPERVVAAIQIGDYENITPKEDLHLEPGVKEELDKIYKKRFNFQAAEVPIGAELVFTRDKSIKAKVVSNGNIEINGQVKSLSKAAQELLRVEYPVQGPIFWEYEEETLDERRRRIEGEED